MGRTPKTNLPIDLIEILQTIGRNIRDLRQQKGFTQARLAKESKVSVATLNEIETRHFRDIRLSTLVVLARTLKVTVLDFMTHSDLALANSDRARLLRASEDILLLAEKVAKKK